MNVTKYMPKFSTLWVSLLGIGLLLSGCSQKEFGPGEPRLITLKTHKLKFNDMGYVRVSGNAVQAELFSAGQAVERFEIDKKICVRQGCMSKSDFNAEYLSFGYPDALLQNVLLGRPIFDGMAMHRSEEGFEQTIKGMAMYDIIYRVSSKEIYFKDRTNNILIKIRTIPK